jgi:hypothetical protein
MWHHIHMQTRPDAALSGQPERFIPQSARLEGIAEISFHMITMWLSNPHWKLRLELFAPSEYLFKQSVEHQWNIMHSSPEGYGISLYERIASESSSIRESESALIRTSKTKLTGIPLAFFLPHKQGDGGQDPPRLPSPLRIPRAAWSFPIATSKCLCPTGIQLLSTDSRIAASIASPASASSSAPLAF